MENKNNNNKSDKFFPAKGENAKIANYAKASYFIKKDKQAKDFLEKHPVPLNFLTGNFS